MQSLDLLLCLSPTSPPKIQTVTPKRTSEHGCMMILSVLHIDILILLSITLTRGTCLLKLGPSMLILLDFVANFGSGMRIQPWKNRNPTAQNLTHQQRQVGVLDLYQLTDTIFSFQH